MSWVMKIDKNADIIINSFGHICFMDFLGNREMKLNVKCHIVYENTQKQFVAERHY